MAAEGPALADGGPDGTPSGERRARDRLRYLLVLSRPRFWFYLAGPVLVGLVYGTDAVSGLFDPVSLVVFGYFLVPANVLLYGVNDVFDADVDAHNPKKSGREARYTGDRTVLAAVVACAVAGLGLFAILPRLAWPWLAGFFVLAVGYSAPPLRFKTTPFLDSLSNGLYVLPGAAAYAALAGNHPPLLAILGGWTWSMAMHTFSAIPDVDPDRAAGIRTTATVLGERGALGYCALCWIASAVAFGLLDARAAALLAVYPLLAAGVAAADVTVDRAYWWFPAINTAAGAAFTLAGLWGLTYG